MMQFAVAVFLLFSSSGQLVTVTGNPHAKRLFEDLMTGYNNLLRPVENQNETLHVKFKLQLTQLLDIHEKNQIMTTNVWLKQMWTDFRLRWKPENYANVSILHIPADMLWLPDIVLYNNADGNYHVTMMTKAKVHSNGTIVWEPPAIYKSMCQIDVTWFPFDEQDCEMKFGSWSYDGSEVNLMNYDTFEEIRTSDNERTIWMIRRGIDMSEYYPSAEWDIMEVPAIRHSERYDCCPSDFVDITFKINIRRRTLFYTVNLIVPCVALSILSTTVFFLPTKSYEKVELSISILVCLTVYFLLLVEIIPATSLVIPLIGKYLLMTMTVVTLSNMLTVVSLNLDVRSSATYNMPVWVRVIFVEWLPVMLQMKRTNHPDPKTPSCMKSKTRRNADAINELSEEGEALVNLQSVVIPEVELTAPSTPDSIRLLKSPKSKDFYGSRRFANADEYAYKYRLSVEYMMKKAADEVASVASYFRINNEDEEMSEDWRYVSQVLDRLLLWLFSITVVVGGCGLILRAPILTDSRVPIG